MEAIRIGNDIVVRWDIFRNGAPAELEKIDDLAIVLSCRGEQRRITDYLIEDNTLVFTFYGRDQKKTGAYTLTYIENESRTGMYTKDEVDAFILVDSSAKAGSDGCQCCVQATAVVELSSKIAVPSDGLSAYEVALKNGFVGSETEWLASLKGDAFTPDVATEQDILDMFGETL